MQIKEVAKVEIGGEQVIFGYKNRHEKSVEDFGVSIDRKDRKDDFWAYFLSFIYIYGFKDFSLLLDRVSSKKGLSAQDSGIDFDRNSGKWISNIMEFEETGVDHEQMMLFMESYLRALLKYINEYELVASRDLENIKAQVQEVIFNHFNTTNSESAPESKYDIDITKSQDEETKQ